MERWGVAWIGLVVACGGGGDGWDAWDPSDAGDGGGAVSSSDDGGDGPAGESSGGEPPAPDDGGADGEDSESGAEPPPSDSGGSDGASCLPATEACADASQCCDGLDCATTSLGQVCCGQDGAPCATENGEDCCGALLCIDGTCGYEVSNACEPPCTPAPALVIEQQRLAAIGGLFLGICGDANHTYGYHVPAANLDGSDYSMQGAANVPACEWNGCAIDIGMDWPASRDWLQWLIVQIGTDQITGVAEVIGSYDGVNVLYWSDSSGWDVDGQPYGGEGHDTWTHVAVYRSTALQDHGILLGWTADGPQ